MRPTLSPNALSNERTGEDGSHALDATPLTTTIEDSRMAGRLTGKRALCTAAGQGIGRAVALAFANEGAEVIATDLDAAKVNGLREDGVAQTAKLDVRNSDAVTDFVADTGAVDILFNCAGFVHHGTILDCTEDDWDFSFDLNVKAMHRVIRAMLPSMLQAGNGGSIINMASVVSAIKGAPNRYAYAATKAAIIGLTKSIAIDFIADGIRCNCICPGTVQSPSLDGRIAELGKSLGGTDKAREMFISRQPMGRLGTVEEIAGLAVYLASDDAAFTTGTSQIIDGGFSI